MDQDSNQKLGVRPFVLGLLSLIPIIGLIFAGLLFSIIWRTKSDPRRKNFLIVTIILIGLNINNSYNIVKNFVDVMPLLQGKDTNNITSQLKSYAEERYSCPSDQVDSVNLTSVHVGTDGVAYGGTVYACHHVYLAHAKCKDKSDQQCSLDFQENTNNKLLNNTQ